MKQIITILTLFYLSTFSFAQDEIVNIPDTNFLNALIEKGIDSNQDGEIQESEAENTTGTLSVFKKNIVSLVGIKAFINITGLSCSINELTELDVTGLSNLN